MDMLQLLVNGLLLGGIYAMLSLGMTIIFGIVGLTNLMHGEIVVLGAYASALIVEAMGVPFLVSLIVTVPSMFLAGFFLQSVLLNRAMERGGETALLVTFGISIILKDGMLLAFSADARHLPSSLATIIIHPGGLDVSLLNLILFAVSLCSVGILVLFLDHTYMGRAIRAVSDDPDAARLSGINVNRVYAIAMGTAMATAAVAGLCVGVKWTFYPSSGNQYLLISFIIVVIGGMGSISGALLAGLLFGLAQVIGGVSYGLVISYVMLLFVLALKPKGLLGK